MRLICQRCNCRSHLVAGAERCENLSATSSFTRSIGSPAFPVP
ncbi:hypothetical protein Pd630_LPD07667 [Rhodococcus opacus PD630]|nr:hypothetical protein Pd630_LPD07667 [Rhodococcus opacus PD630]